MAIYLSSSFVSGIFRCQSNDKNVPDHNKQHIKLLYNSFFVVDEIIAIGYNKATARKQLNNVPWYFITILLHAPVWQLFPSQPSAQLHVYCPSRSVQRPPCWQGELRHSSISENMAVNLSSSFVSGIFRCQSNDKNDPDHNKQHIKLLYNSSFVGRWNYRYWLQ